MSDLTAPPSPPSASRAARLGPFGLVLLTLIYGGLIGFWFGPYAGGSDSAGYLLAARGLGHGNLHFPVREAPGVPATAQPVELLMPLGLTRHGIDAQHLVPTYPLGFPLHLTAAAAFVGESRAPRLVGIALAMAALLVTAGLARQAGLAWPSTLLVVALLGASPIMIYQAQQPLSDIAALVWVGLALLAAHRSRERDSDRWAAAAGFAFALAVLVRPTNLVIAPALAWALGRPSRRWLITGLAGIPGALFLGWQNQQLYGHILASGYPQLDRVFSLSFVGPNTAAVAQHLAFTLSPWWAILGCLAVVALGIRRHPAAGWLTLWLVPLTAFYLIYFYTGDHWSYQRFLLPAYPVLLIAPFAALSLVLARPGRRRLGAVLVAVAALTTLAWQIRGNHEEHTNWMGTGEATYAVCSHWADEVAPPGSPILAMQLSAALFYYTDHPVVRPEWLKAAGYLDLINASNAAGLPVFALGYLHESPRLPAEHFPADAAHWTRVGEQRDVILWRRDASPPPALADL